MAYTVAPSLAGTWRVVRTDDGKTVSGDFTHKESAEQHAREMEASK